MPSKSEKQRKFFGAVMGAKKGKGKVKGAAKKVAKEMPKKEIKKFLKKESYDDVINSYLKKYLIEMDVRMDPREGFDGDPFIDPTEDMGEKITPDNDTEQENREFTAWLKEKFKDRPGFLKNLRYDQDMVSDLFYDFKQEKAQGKDTKPDILTFYGLK
jgi:hypothetical protein